MIEFFSPVQIETENIFQPHSLAEYFDIHTEFHIPDWEENDVLIFDISQAENRISGIGNNQTIHQIRQALYSLFPGRWNLKIADLGTLVLGEDETQNQKLIQEIVSYFSLHAKNIILLGELHSYTYSITKGISNSEKIVNCSIVDSKVDFKPNQIKSSDLIVQENFISSILWDESIHLNNLHLIGCQSYYQPPAFLDFLTRMYIDCFRLGEIKPDLIKIEPELRTSHFLSLDIHAIEHSVMPLQENPVPNGFNGIEICQLSRMSGLGENNKILGIFGYKEINHGDLTGENLISQIIWYYLEGKNESLLLKSIGDKKEMITFHVPNNLIKMKFHKQPETELWWVEFNDLNIQDQLFPCSYEDYKIAVKNKISERIRKIIEKNKA